LGLGARTHATTALMLSNEPVFTWPACSTTIAGAVGGGSPTIADACTAPAVRRGKGIDRNDGQWPSNTCALILHGWHDVINYNPAIGREREREREGGGVLLVGRIGC
jgi:hypothetical protein